MMPHVMPLPTVRANQLPVNEYFASLQGEGRWLGHPAIFIRFAYCNLGCAWCDTKFTWEPSSFETEQWQSFDRIARFASDIIDQDHRSRTHVVLTGGEPMLHRKQLPELIHQLRGSEFTFFEIETNGLFGPSDELRELVSWWNCSPKLSNNGMSMTTNLNRDAIAALVATDRADFKFVVQNEQDIDEIERWYVPLLPADRIWLMPEGTTRNRQMQRLPWVTEIARKRGWNVSPRLHILLWDNERKR